MIIQPGDTILFHGDSITDMCHTRHRPEREPNFELGSGYVTLVAARLLKQFPGHGLKIYNRGTSGNEVIDLLRLWRTEALALKPTVISILIGVNDTAHKMRDAGGSGPDHYEALYRLILEDTREVLPETQLVLCEPFYTRVGQVNERWAEDVAQRQGVVRRLAMEFGAVFVGFQAAIDKVAPVGGPAHWVYDGVHPTPAGYAVLSATWLDAVLG